MTNRTRLLPMCRSISCNALALGLAVTASAAAAQDTQTTPTTTADGDIVVTATRRETTLQETPLSISALSTEQLQQRGVLSTADAVTLVPGVSLLSSAPGSNEITIRGVNTATSSQTVAVAIVNSTTSTYVNQLPVSTTIQKTPDFRFIDLERVEILRGPQGTLYGQSAMGGVVRYITNKPDASKFAGGFSSYVSATKDGGVNFGVESFANLPLVDDKLAIRFVGYGYRNDGFIDVVGRGNVKNANKEGTLGGRAALRFTPSDRLTIDLSYLYHHVDLDSTQTISGIYAPTRYTFSDTDPTAYPYFYGAPLAETPRVRPVSTDRLDFQHLQPSRETDHVVNGELLYGFGPVDANLIVGHKRIKTRNFIESGDITGGSTGSFTNATLTGDVKSDTAEIRVVSAFGNSPVDFIAGAYYERNSGVLAQRGQSTGGPFTTRLAVGGAPITFAFPGDVTLNAARQLDYKEIAFYGELTLNLGDRIKLTGGYRRAHVENNYRWLYSRGTLDAFYGRNPAINQGATENVNLYKGNLSFQVTDDILLYAQAASGYRPGGFNVGNAINAIPDNEFGSDTLWNYEVGARTTLFDRMLTFNVAGFRIDWSDIQLPTRGGAPAFYASTQNAGEARIQGVEVEAVVRPTRGLSLSGNYAYTDAKLRSVTTTAFGTANPAFVGARLPGTARHTVSVLGDFRTSMSDRADLFTNATYRHVGSRPGDLGVAGAVAPAYDTLDLRVGVILDESWELVAFADNVTNEIPILRVLTTALPNYSIYTIGRPRTIGLRGSFRY